MSEYTQEQLDSELKLRELYTLYLDKAPVIKLMLDDYLSRPVEDTVFMNFNPLEGLT